MAVYLDKSRNSLRVDGYRPMVTCHMIADGVEELIDFAKRLGMSPSWFQPWSHPHFDVNLTRQKVAVQLGAIVLERKPFVLKMREYRTRVMNDPAEAQALWEMTKRFGGSRS